jgi:hypothetical protein
MAELPNYDVEIIQGLAPLAPDWFLQHLVSLANENEIRFSVTLFLGGSIVTGNIISGREYFESLGVQVGAAIGLPEEQGREMYRAIIDEYYASKGEPTGQPDQGKTPPSYIHLKNARVFQGATQLPENYDRILWRGKLTGVTGLIIGELRRAAA